uniref:Uncharacterized protein n=1 Tax=Lactuca sativa TaxID=4236 RepID=A0A9R1XHN1_LACSA|nr:hypothetical protein LSAT_V11C300130870 [Lactuca sativa]
MLPVILDSVHFKGGTLLLLAYAVYTVLSFVGLQYWTKLSYVKLKSDGLMGENLLHPGVANRVLELLLSSYTTVALVFNFVLNIFVLVILSLKTIFFDELHATESRKMVERLVNYVIYKGTFLPLVVPPTLVRAGLWSTWLTILCYLKMFQALARDQLERLNASPSATPWTYFRSEDTVEKAASVVIEFSLDVEEIITEENNNQQGEDVTEKAREADVKVVEDLDLDLDSRQPNAGDVNIEEDMDMDTSGQSPDIVPVPKQQNEVRLRRIKYQSSCICFALLFTTSKLQFTPTICMLSNIHLYLLLNLSSNKLRASMFLLVFFEPLCIAFETLQAILVHRFQLVDIWVHHSTGNTTNSKISKLLDMSAAGKTKSL